MRTEEILTINRLELVPLLRQRSEIDKKIKAKKAKIRALMAREKKA